ncbi:glycosyltransferase family 4 protein [Pontibacter roseus]|uniref:glycosyltransferase family 4 protein n=1 Tax=Pontibacter roseus TaxID=336989 RepID=UPI000376F897|nr:glycosyltransferase family 4 protein [Pontibacter roseus]
MKLAVFSPIALDPTLGASKHKMEQAKALEKLGWYTSLFDYRDLGLTEKCFGSMSYRELYSAALKEFLIENASQYDVVLYECDTLPYPRSLFPEKPLFIASPALLFYHFQTIKYPLNIKNRVRKFLYGLISNTQTKHHALTLYTLQQADVVQVQNICDKAVLEQHGFAAEKLITVPCGLTAERKALLNQVENYNEAAPCVAFIGTFDFRKGAVDFPKIVAKVIDQVPECTFRFLGTRGMLVNAQQVLDFFPKKLWASISVTPTFSPEELPYLLSNCQVGMFPSYIESFGIGVLEMMAAGIPVVCYSSPGPSDFVPDSLLIKPGDTNQFASRLIDLLRFPEERQKYSQVVLSIAEHYDWDRIGLGVARVYQELINRKKQVTETAVEKMPELLAGGR